MDESVQTLMICGGLLAFAVGMGVMAIRSIIRSVDSATDFNYLPRGKADYERAIEQIKKEEDDIGDGPSKMWH